MRTALKRLLFYWAASFILATGLYYILWLIMPEHAVFGGLYRMFLYHWQHPLAFIAIPCFFYGLIATLLAKTFLKQKLPLQILLTAVIIALTVLISSPFGGMLWHYYDMQAGYFPQDWFSKMTSLGYEWGMELGWYIVMLSVPYNIIGSVLCYFLTKKGSELFNNGHIVKNGKDHPSTFAR